MSRIVYVNGEYLPEAEAKVSVFDRGFLFADAVYEVTAVLEGKLVDFEAHQRRLERSLSELGMRAPMAVGGLLAVHRELVRCNGLDEGLVYLQVTRGSADRDFAYADDLEPTLVLFTQQKALRDSIAVREGIKVISVPDIRWARRDIKTVQLLASSRAKMEARRAGKDDAWLLEDGYVTEGTASNAFIVSPDGRVVTRSLSTAILHGITRAAVLDCIRELDTGLEERAFSIEEAKSAAEAFVTSATGFVTPVV